MRTLLGLRTVEVLIGYSTRMPSSFIGDPRCEPRDGLSGRASQINGIVPTECNLSVSSDHSQPMPFRSFSIELLISRVDDESKLRPEDSVLVSRATVSE